MRYTLMFVLAVIWVLLFIARHRHLLMDGQYQTIYGGAFDIHKFITGLRKKYTSPHEHIEIELKLKESGVYDRLAKYVRAQPNHTEENTINRIWRSENGTSIIQTTTSSNDSVSKIKDSPESINTKWSTKKRLSKYDTDLGPIAISLECELDERPANIFGEPMLVRHKNRISAELNKYWRIDCTQVEQDADGADTTTAINEVEIEYIAADYWNAIKRIGEIKEFLATEHGALAK